MGEKRKSVDINYHKKKAKLNRLKRRITLIVFLMLVLLGFALFAPFFSIENISCTGNEIVSLNDIVDRSGITLGNNIYRTSLYSAKKKIGTIPYIHTVTAKRKFPDVIELHVVESELAAYIDAVNEYIYIDRFGKVLEVQSVPPYGIYPVIENAEPTEYIPGEKFITENEENFNFIVATMTEMVHNSIIGDVNIINCENKSYLYQNRIEVKLGSIENIEDKIKFLAPRTIEEIGPNGKGTLDLSGKNIVFKPM